MTISIFVHPSHNPHNCPQVSVHIDLMGWGDWVTRCLETYTGFIMKVTVRIPLGEIKVWADRIEKAVGILHSEQGN